MSASTQEMEALQRRAAACAAQRDALERELEMFTRGVSHDLRAPVWAVDGLARILQEEYTSHLPAEAQRFLQLLRHNTQQLGRQVEDLMALVWVGRQPLHLQTLAVTDVARQAWGELGDQREGRQVELSIGQLPSCRADRALLQHLLVNLLSNALKFTRGRSGARIEVGWEKGSDGQCAYFVRDNGVGFDMAYADRLFGVFGRLHRSEDYAGTGVGLAIVQRIVNRHGGRVWAEAKINEGATLRFTLPGEG